MSRHDGVSCDSCLKNNFRGKRFKCLVCYDYDLCSACYEAGATNTRHNTDHPMQCILTRLDYDLYYGGEVLANIDQPQSYTCPYCGKMGFTEGTLHDHVTSEHSETSFEVVCPICASQAGGDPNLMTDDFASHLALEHRVSTRDLISFLDEPVPSTRVPSIRRISQTVTNSRGGAGGRPRRSNMHFSVFSNSSPSSRETAITIDPIAELLSQLSGVRRTTTNTNTTTTSTANLPSLQQLQMQLQFERQVNTSRQTIEHLPRRQISNELSKTGGTNLTSLGSSTLMLNHGPSTITQQFIDLNPVVNTPTNYLLPVLIEELSCEEFSDQERRVHSEFLNELMFSTLLTPGKVNTVQSNIQNILQGNEIVTPFSQFMIENFKNVNEEEIICPSDGDEEGDSSS